MLTCPFSRRVRRLALVLLIGAVPMMAAAAPSPEQIAAHLRQEGYETVHTHRTWLGRIRIRASGHGKEREIILHRGTGDVLRDVIWNSPLPPTGPQTTPDPDRTEEPHFHEDDWLISDEGDVLIVCEGSECIAYDELLGDDLSDEDEDMLEQAILPDESDLR